METLRQALAFFILSNVKVFSHLFYKREFNWLTPPPESPWERSRMIVLLNHTSLYEPLYIQGLSFSFLWKLSKNLSVPGADVTLKRPVVGAFWKLMMPSISSVSRKSDRTWSTYLESIKKDSIIMIAPEGRMKRPSGLDRYGKPMSVRPGIADIVLSIPEGGMVLCFSGGLHHIQRPGQHFPRLFKKIRLNLEYLDLNEYRSGFAGSSREKKLLITRDLQSRLENNCPTINS